MELVNLHFQLQLDQTSLYGDASANFGNTNTGGAYGAGRFGYSINNTSSVVTATTGSAAADLG
jgi:hypothetical protein